MPWKECHAVDERGHGRRPVVEGIRQVGHRAVEPWRARVELAGDVHRQGFMRALVVVLVDEGIEAYGTAT
jgi:hypothetical protein